MQEIKISVPDSVYAPMEDSRLLAKAAAQKCFGKILEIGCGSGFVCISLAKIKPGAKVIACDINKAAVAACKKNAKTNGVRIGVFESDLFSSIEKGEKFDFILFNPPYLPTEEKEKVKGNLNFAFDGGKSGLEAVFRFLEEAGKYLKKGGKILLVASDAANLKKLRSKIKKCKFSYKIIGKESFFFERIYVYMLKRD
ncbi:hypothetical protein COU37_05245 [Candidatus Micrarchaeota archaeon CG10_big_fil_rev_8_21_14_0_10_45_29]|nr:MAG: hypothetical protein COU37_05245 [Candidatus Micrarchaeota archaeon CG10_big_fil_rev_8_21_14_0_10_45_29]